MRLLACVAVTVLASQANAGAQTPYLVKDISSATGGSDPLDLTAVGSVLMFKAKSDTGVQGLWRSDGSPEGTVLLRSFPEGLPGRNSCLTRLAVNGVLYFSARAGRNQLWRSDGTAAGTTLVSDFSTSGGSLLLCDFAASRGVLYFGATFTPPSPLSGLWRSDGTAAGTTLVKNVVPSNITDVNGTLFFRAQDQLWKSDGTPAGTVMVAAIKPALLGTRPLGYAHIGGTVFLSADNGADGNELWRSDGTPAGTVMVRDINPAGSSDPAYFAVLDGKVLFQAADGPSNIELWASDGTLGGTYLVKDILPGPSPGVSIVLDFATMGGRVFFKAIDGFAYALWASDGTEMGTVPVMAFPGDIGAPDSTVTRLLAEGDSLFFAANEGTAGFEPWASDGTPSGTMRLGDLRPGMANSLFSPEFTAAGNRVFFSADDGTHGFELWAMDVVPKATGFHVLQPCRVADTRQPPSPTGGPALGANSSRAFPVAGSCGVPPTAKAVALTVTATGATDSGDLRVYPAGTADVPLASTLNFMTGRPRAGNGVFRLGTAGQISVTCDMPAGSLGATHLVVDVYGYFE